MKNNHLKKTQNTSSYVLITGASAGIGRALAFEFARAKKNLLLVALPATGLEELSAELKTQFGVNVHFFNIDLTQALASFEILQWCRSNSFAVEVLVNNAGFGNLGAFENTQSGLLENMMNLNNSVLVKMTHHFIPELKKFPQSYIMNLGSLAAFMPIPSKSVYAATKSFVYTFSHSLYFELKSFNIHVSCLCPGGTLTERVKKSLHENQINRNSFCQLPEEVAVEAVKQMYQKQFRIVPGWQNKLLYWFSQALPDFIKIRIIQTAFKSSRQNPLPDSASAVSLT